MTFTCPSQPLLALESAPRAWLGRALFFRPVPAGVVLVEAYPAGRPGWALVPRTANHEPRKDRT
jgi:hypothetical protein